MSDSPHDLYARYKHLARVLQTRFDSSVANRSGDFPLLTRLTAHLGIIALVVIGLLLSGIEIRAGVGAGEQSEALTESELPDPRFSLSTSPGDLTLSAVPFTIQQKKPTTRLEVVQYTVKPGDNVSVIAARYGITPDSVIWANPKLEENPDALSIGQLLYIPPVDGVLHIVGRGETIQLIAARFKASVEDILNDPFNLANHDLKSEPPQLAANTFLMVPGGEKPYVARKVIYRAETPANAAKGTRNFMWPTTACISQYFWTRHPGIDLATATGTPVVAADSGYVEIVGWDNSGYGNMILINHGNGFVTRYAHLSSFAVQAGQSVKRGDLIGRIGSTGRSTGPHLHFEIIDKGVQRNPSFFLLGRAPGLCRR